MKRLLTLSFLFVMISLAGPGQAEPAREALTLLGGSSYSYKMATALEKVREDPAAGGVDLVYYTEKDLAENGIDPAVITRSGIIILDDMYRSLREFVLDHADFKAAKVFGLSTVDNDPQRIMADKAVKAYARPLTQKNLAALVRFLLHRELGLDIAWGAPQKIPAQGIFHPAGDQVFDTFDDYEDWYRKAGHFTEKGAWIGIPEMSAYVYPGETGRVVGRLVEKLEAAGINVLPVYGYPASGAADQFFFDENTGKSRIDLVATLAFKFSPRDPEGARKMFERLNVPVLNPLRIHFLTIDQWEEDPQGLSPMEISYAMANPEVYGLIEPSAVGARLFTGMNRPAGPITPTPPLKRTWISLSAGCGPG